MQFRRYTDNTLILYTALFHVCHTYEVDLSFNSHNCDESARRVSTDKEYILTWMGQTEPKLCTFNFTGGGSEEIYTNFKVCFKSVELKLPSFDMKLVVTAGTKKLVYDGRTTIIEEICTDDAWNMMFKIDVTDYYRESSRNIVKLKITAKKKDDTDSSTIVSTILGWLGSVVEILFPIVIFVIIGCTLRHPAVRGKLRELIGYSCDKINGRRSSRRQSVVDENSFALVHSEPTQSEATPAPTPLGTNPQNIELYQSSESIISNSAEILDPPPKYEDVVDSSASHVFPEGRKRLY